MLPVQALASSSGSAHTSVQRRHAQRAKSVFYRELLARRHQASANSEALAQESGTVPVATFDELLAASEALVFAVPPRIQVELGIRAAAAGRAMVLEKPLAAMDDGGGGGCALRTLRPSAAW